MKEPRRLLEESRDPLALELIHAWQTQSSPARVRERAAIALGVGGVTALATGVANGGALAGARSAFARLAVVKWFAGGALGILAMSGGVEAIRSRPIPEPTSPKLVAPPAVVVTSRADENRPAVLDHAPEVLPPTTSLPSASTPSAPTPRPTPPPRAGKPVPESIAQEIAALDRARQTLAQGHANATLSELDRLEARGHSGTFTPELIWLRLEALDRVGEHARARELARRYLAQRPGGPLEERIRARFR